MKTAAGYLRRSTDRQPLSLERQREVIEAFAAERGIRVARWYQDDAESGWSADEREAFQRMVADVERRRDVDQVLVYDVGRFGRTDMDEAGFYRHRLRKAGAEVVYVAEPGLTGGETDELIVPIFQYQKRAFLREVSRSSIDGMLRRARQGAWCGGPAPFGYARELRSPAGVPVRRLARGERAPTEDGSMVFLVPGDAQEAAAVRLAWQLRWVLGLGLDTVRDQVTATGVRPARSRVWQTSAIRAIVTNPVYTGRSSYGVRTQAKFFRATPSGPTARGRQEAGSFVRDPHQEPTVVEGAHHALAPAEAVEAFRAWERAELARRRAGEGRHDNQYRVRSEFLLTGLVRCARCGFKFVGSTTRRKGHVYPKYFCSGTVEAGREVCPMFAIRRDELEGWVIEEIGRRWPRDLDLGALRRDLLAGADVAMSIESGEGLRRRIRTLEERMRAIAAAIDPAHADVANAAIGGLKLERAALARRLAELEQGNLTREILEAEVAAVVEILALFRTTFEVAPPPQKKAIVRCFAAGLEVDPRTGALTLALWRWPRKDKAPVDLSPSGAFVSGRGSGGGLWRPCAPDPAEVVVVRARAVQGRVEALVA